MSSTASRIIKNTGWLYAKMGITMFVSLYTTRLILNGLGASDFGIYNIVGGAISMLGFLNASLAAASQRFMSYAEGEHNLEKQKSIFNISLILHGIIAIVVLIMLLIAGFFFFDGVLNIPQGRTNAAIVVYGSLIVSTLFTILNVPYDAVMNAHENMKYYAVIGVFESLLKLLVALICVQSVHDKLIVYGVLSACIPLLTLSIMKIYCHRHYSECIIAPIRFFDKSLAWEMTSFGGWSFMQSITSMITHYGVGIVLNNFFGTILNAAQGIANQLSGQLTVFSKNLLKALRPAITKEEGAGDRQKVKEITFVSSKFSYFIYACFAIPFCIQMHNILPIWLKSVPDWAVCFAILQLIRSLSDQLFLVVDISISAQGDIKSLSIVRSILYILPIILIYVAFSLGFPPYWLYLIWISLGFITGLVSLLYADRLCGIKMKEYLVKVMFPCLFVSVVSLFIGIIPMLLSNSTWMQLLSFIVCFLAFIILAYYVGCTNLEKKFLTDSVYSILGKIKNR